MFLPPSDSSIVLEIDKEEYKPGETVSGKIKLRCAKPIKARALIVSVRGEAWVNVSCGSGKHRRGKSETQVFHKQEFSFGGDREYQNEEYSFSYTIPSDAPPTIKSLGGVLMESVITEGNTAVKGTIMDVPNAPKLPVNLPPELIGQMQEMAMSETNHGAGFRWIVEAKLDIALAMDVNTTKTFFVV